MKKKLYEIHKQCVYDRHIYGTGIFHSKVMPLSSVAPVLEKNRRSSMFESTWRPYTRENIAKAKKKRDKYNAAIEESLADSYKMKGTKISKK